MTKEIIITNWTDMSANGYYVWHVNCMSDSKPKSEEEEQEQEQEEKEMMQMSEW